MSIELRLSSHRRIRAPRLAFVSLFVALSCGVPILAAACDYIPLVSGVQEPLAQESFLEFTQASTAWTAVGIRPDPGNDWDLFAYSSTAAEPFCLSGDLASSVLFFGVDVIVGNFHHVAPGTYYIGATRPGGTGGAVIEWDNDADAIVVDADPQLHQFVSGDVVRIWDVALQGGVTYTIVFSNEGGCDGHVLLFLDTGAAFWGGRSTRVVESPSSTHYTAPSTGIYGLAVVDDDGGACRFRVGVHTAAVAAPVGPIPAGTSMRAITPNPSAGEARIDFDLAASGDVRFDVVDVAGRIVSRGEEQHYEAGTWSAPLHAHGASGDDLAAGVYFVQMIVDGRRSAPRRFVRLE